ncbi:long-chain-fatty-acid--CoA ligase ACSBG2-like [Dysidea avara]|uniref:long-chain-fatty-acid--CoA ligase ACSBG2-like n=1 Tax=Dysidea avara TaxID=196820 RepID=UPI00332B40AA
MSDSNETTPETAVEQQSSTEEQTTEQTTTAEQEPEEGDVTQQSSAEEQTTDQTATAPESEKSNEDDATTEASKDSKQDEPTTLEADDKKDEEPAVLDTSKQDEPTKEGEEEVTAKPEQVELTTKADTKDEDKPIKSGKAKEEEVTAAKEEEPVVAKKPRKMYCLDPTDTVDIAVGESGVRSLKPITIPQFMKKTVDQLPDGKALCWKNNKEDPWQSLTYTQYLKLIYNTAKSFLKLGLEPYHSVGILGFNSVEWFASSLGAMFAGGLSTGIYTTNSPEACHYILENCKANIVVVENQKQLDKIIEIRDKLPHLKAIVQYRGEVSKDYPDAYTWEKFLEVGKDMDDSVIDDIINKQEPNQCAMLVYTSGTTGNPKGVMLSHDNLTWVTEALLDTLGRDQWKFGRERVVSYLPLSHIAGTVADMFLGVPFGATVYFAQPDALKGTLVVTLKEVKPTFFFGVPRVWEKMKEKMEEIGRTITGFKAKISAWGRGVGLRGNQNIQKGQSVPWGWTFANMLVFKKVREGLGLTECRQMTVGAAPIHRETLEFFMSVNMPVLELYGMSECTGPQTLSIHSATHWRTGSCGKTMSGAETKIDKPDEHGDGEILFRGRHIFMGYLGMAEKTRETIDDEGWLHSGDIGRIDKDGFLYITGRIKELIITAGGENVPPVYIEDCIKTEVPFLSNVMLIGDKRKFLTCLLTLKCIIHPDTGEATDDLQPQALKMFQDLGSECTTVSQVIETEDKAVFKAIQDGIDRYNTNHIISNAQKVQKWTLLDTDFTIPGGELGPTLKLKRPAVMKKYESTIEKFYAES